MKPRKPSQRGYTLIEVMVSIAISAIGIAGIVYMQTATVRSNQDAFETQMATNFARTWSERIKRDALGWTAPGDPNPAAMFGSRTPLANDTNYFVPTPTGVDTWSVPRPMANSLSSPGANFHGVDVGARDVLLTGSPVVTNADTYFCANTNFAVVHRDAGGLATAIRATVRVWWMRKSSLSSTDYATAGFASVRTTGCQAFIPSSTDLQDAGAGRYRVVYLATILHWTAPT